MNTFKWFYDNTMKANIEKRHFLSNLEINSKMTMKNFSTKIQTLKNF